MKIYTSAQQLIGHTPILELVNIEKKLALKGKLLAKLESFNPTGSAKDRAALYMLDKAEEQGLVDKNTVIIEPTSGNTGIGLASIGAQRGYRVIIVMPDSMSLERRQLMAAYGAELVLTPGAEGMKGCVAKADELAAGFEKAYIPGQFVNPSNSLAHYETTGPEIWEDTDGAVDIFVAGVGTGGTISGAARFLKEKNPNIKIVAVEPDTSPLLSKGYAGKHGLQGIGANFVPEILERELIDDIMTVSTPDAYKMGREVGRHEGILVGISAGAALHAAAELARREENSGKNIVALVPDTGDHYLSTEMFAGGNE